LFNEPLFEYPLERSFGLFFIDTPFFLPHLLFVDTHEVRVEEVVKGVEGRIDGIQDGEGQVSGEAVIADSFTDYIAVFLLDEGVIVLVVQAASGESDAVGFTPVFEAPVDKFGAVIVIQAP
jgi:hypothetical protein